MSPSPFALKTIAMDERGRVTIGRLIRRNGLTPSLSYSVDFGPDQTIILAPVRGSSR